MTQAQRDKLLNIFAALFALMALSNLLKPLQIGEQTGFVLFGTRLTGTANAIAGPLFGLYLAVYAHAIWKRRRYAIPMAHAYAVYVILNLVLYTMTNTIPAGIGYMLFGIVYSTIAIGVSLGAAILLTQQKNELH
ncbi:MAG TPA: hypothetical protein VEB21_00005 [Terriglobales bacterium]|nr:hypothetical protein [Terriglobales bacterium]